MSQSHYLKRKGSTDIELANIYVTPLLDGTPALPKCMLENSLNMTIVTGFSSLLPIVVAWALGARRSEFHPCLQTGSPVGCGAIHYIILCCISDIPVLPVCEFWGVLASIAWCFKAALTMARKVNLMTCCFIRENGQAFGCRTLNRAGSLTHKRLTYKVINYLGRIFSLHQTQFWCPFSILIIVPKGKIFKLTHNTVQ